MLNVPITPPRVPLIDERTGLIDRAWYLFFLSLNNAAQTIESNPDVGPNADTLVASYDAALRALAQDVSTLPPAVQTPVGDDPAVDNGLLSTVTEMQKQIDALNSLPPPLQGTVTSVTATAPVVSSGGTTPDISMPAASTSVNGYLTSTDWNTFNGKAPATSGTSILYGNGTGGFNNVTIGTGVSFAAGTLSATGSGGTVTSVSVVSANGFAGTVATATTTPAITLTTSITGVLKGDGTAISAAVVNTDYFAPSAPVTKTADFTVAATDVWLINNKSGSTCTVTLPAASSWTGRVLRFQNYQVQTLVSASSNVVPLAGGAAGTSILLASSGDSATLVSDGSNWLMTQYVPNNILLLE
jgi:hypothetical protein